MKKFLSAILVIAMLLSTLSFNVLAEIDLTQDVIEIASVEELKAFSEAVNTGNNFAGKTVSLTTDIDLQNEEWTPIGTDANQFSGEFNGNDHIISNLKNTQDTVYKGLFGSVNGGYIHNLKLNNVEFSGTITGSAFIGALVGYIYIGAVIRDVAVENVNYTLSVSGNSIGGLVGYTYDSHIADCTVKNATFDITSTGATSQNVGVGGMIGQGRGLADSSTLGNYVENVKPDALVIGYTDCKVDTVTVSVNGSATVGGFIAKDGYGHWANYGKNCKVESLSVTCEENDTATYVVGGFMGYNYGANYGADYAFENCTTTGAVTSDGTNTDSVFGGFIGWVGGRPTALGNCTANVEITVDAGDIGGFLGETQQYFEHEYKFDSCEATGNISTDNGTAGAFAGNLQHGGDGTTLNVVIENSSASGTVKGTVASGFVGTVNDDKNGTTTGGTITINNCEATDRENVTGETVYEFWQAPETGELELIDLTRRFVVEADKTDVKAGDEVTVTITYESDADLMDAVWTLNYDSALFDCEDATEEGKIADKLFKGETFGDGTVLGTYTFKAKQQTNTTSGIFSISDAETSRGTEYHDDKYTVPECNTVEVTISLKEYEIEFLVDGEKQVDDEATEDVNEAEVLEINFDGKPHKLEAVVTPEASKVEYFVEGEEEARLNPPTFTEKGTYEVTCKVIPASGTGFEATEKVFTLTIIEPEFIVEVNTNADEDYVAGKKLVLVYTNVKDCSFKYGDNYMVDVTERGYWYKDWEDENSVEKEYSYVYAIVVDAIENGEVADYEANISDDTLNTDVMMVEAYDSDINISGTTNIRDISTIYSVYNAYEVSFSNYDYMTHVLKADTNGDKVVDGHDTNTVVNAVYPLN